MPKQGTRAQPLVHEDPHMQQSSWSMRCTAEAHTPGALCSAAQRSPHSEKPAHCGWRACQAVQREPTGQATKTTAQRTTAGEQPRLRANLGTQRATVATRPAQQEKECWVSSAKVSGSAYIPEARGPSVRLKVV